MECTRRGVEAAPGKVSGNHGSAKGAQVDSLGVLLRRDVEDERTAARRHLLVESLRDPIAPVLIQVG